MANKNIEQQGKNVDGRPEVDGVNVPSRQSVSRDVKLKDTPEVDGVNLPSRQSVSKDVKLNITPNPESMFKETVFGLFKNPKINDILKGMDMVNKSQLLDALIEEGAIKVTTNQRKRLEQLKFIKMALESIKANISEGKTLYQNFVYHTERGGITQARALKVSVAIGSLDDVAIELAKNPDATIDQLLPKAAKDILAEHGGQADPKYWRYFDGFIDRSGHVPDVERKRVLSTQMRELVNFLFEQRDYASVRVLIEDKFFKKQFEKERKLLDVQTTKELDKKAEDDIDSMVSDGMIASWRKEIMAKYPEISSIELGKKTMEYRDMLVTYQANRLKNFAAFKKTENNPFGLTGSMDLELLKMYKDGFDTHDEWGTTSKQGKDFILDQLIISAPLIIVSGIGAAKFVHALGAGAKFLLTNEAIAGFTGLAVSEGAAVASGAIAEGVVATSARGKYFWNLGRALKIAAHGASFEALHTGLQGYEHLVDRDLPTWGRSIILTTLTLGAFKFAGNIGKNAAEALSSRVSIFSGPIARTITSFIAKGSSEVATMLALEALENMYASGKLPDTPSAEQLVAALISVGALHVVGGVAEVGGRTFNLGALKVYEKASEVSAKRFADYEAKAAENVEGQKMADLAAKEYRRLLRDGLSGENKITPEQATELVKKSDIPAEEAGKLFDLFRGKRKGWEKAALVALSVGKVYEAIQPSPAVPVKASAEVRTAEIVKDSRFAVVEGVGKVTSIPGGGAFVVPLRGNHGTSSEGRTEGPRRHSELAKKSQEGINADLTKLGVPKAVTDSLMGEYNQLPDELKKYTRMFVTVSGEMITPYSSIDMEALVTDQLKLAGLTKEDAMKKVSEQMGMDMPEVLRAGGASWEFILSFMAIAGIIGGGIALWKVGITRLVTGAARAGLSEYNENLTKEEASLASLPTDVYMVEGLLDKLVEVSPAPMPAVGETRQADGKSLSNNLAASTKHAIRDAYETAKEFARIIAVDRDLRPNGAKERANRQDLFTLIFNLSCIDAIIKDPLLSTNDRTALISKKEKLLSDFDAFTYKIKGSKDLDAVIKSLRGKINVGGMSAQSIEAALVEVAANLGRLLPRQRLAVIGAARPFYELAVREAARAASDKLKEATDKTGDMNAAKAKAVDAANNTATEAIKSAKNAKTEAIKSAEKVATEAIEAADNAINEAAPKRNDANSKRDIADLASREAAEVKDAHENLVELKEAAGKRTPADKREALLEISERASGFNKALLDANAKKAAANVAIAVAKEAIRNASGGSAVDKAKAKQALAKANALKNAAERNIDSIKRSLEALSVEKANVEMPITEHTSRVNASAIKLRDLALKAERSEAAAKKAEAEAETIEALAKDSAKVKTAAEKTKTEAIEAAEKIEAAAVEAANKIKDAAIVEANKPHVENLDESSPESAAQRELRHKVVVDFYEGLLRSTGKSQTDIDAMRNIILSTTPTPTPADIRGSIRKLYHAIKHKPHPADIRGSTRKLYDSIHQNALATPWKRNTARVALTIVAWLAFANLAPPLVSSVTGIFKSDDAEGEDGDTPSEEGGTNTFSDPTGGSGGGGADQLN